MKNKEEKSAASYNAPRPYRVRLPGFVSDEDVGLGEIVKRVTAAAGIKPCGGCARRAATLNRWMSFSGQPLR
jgi:hypothetical protein